MEQQSDKLINTPMFGEQIYQNLPNLLRTLTKEFEPSRERDIILLSSLITLSGCFSSIKGKYALDWVHPNLFAFIIAPPASGKGIMKFSKLLGKKIELELTKDHKSLENKYAEDLRSWNRLNKSNPELPPPDKPKYPALFIPGNISATALIYRLNDSNSAGIIFETEADTVAAALKQDWGNFSDLFRKAFHHESVTISRVGNNLRIGIEHPRLSIQLSGTPSQVSKLITSNEDGLMSRFMFYCFAQEMKWKSTKPNKEANDLAELFLYYADEVYDIYKILQQKKYTFELTDKQFDWLDRFFATQIVFIDGKESKGSTIKRLGIIAFRICTILTVLRNHSKLNGTTNLISTDDDFKTALRIVKVLIDHAMVMHNLLPGNAPELQSKAQMFYDLIPIAEKFTRADANKWGESLRISERTVGNYLKSFKDVQMIKDDKYGSYIRPK